MCRLYHKCSSYPNKENMFTLLLVLLAELQLGQALKVASFRKVKNDCSNNINRKKWQKGAKLLEIEVSESGSYSLECHTNIQGRYLLER